MKLSFVWWNTSLSPTSRPNRSSGDERIVASAVIEWLARNTCADIICLGEVSEQDIASMEALWNRLGYSVRKSVSSIGRTSFDTCVLYRAANLFLLDGENLSSLKGTTTLKVGQRIDFAVSDNETLIHLFVSHWPSRLWCSENHADRHLLGLRLRDAIEETGVKNGDTHVVVLGDFNDEPFDPSLSQQLMATRDRDLAARKPHLLYNPFWRHMGPTRPYRVGNAGHDVAGSYYYHSDKSSKWHTFDQILFSSSFLGRTAWHLREDMVNVIDVPGYTELVLERKVAFDHLPVIGVIEREA